MGEIKRQNTKITQIPHLPCAHQCPHGLCATLTSNQNQHSCVCARPLTVGQKHKTCSLFPGRKNSLVNQCCSELLRRCSEERRVFGYVKGFHTVLSFLFLLSFAASSTNNLKKSINIVFILHLILLLYQQDSLSTLFFYSQKVLGSFPKTLTPFLSSGGIKKSVDQVKFLYSTKKNDIFLISKYSIPMFSAKPLSITIPEITNGHFTKP